MRITITNEDENYIEKNVQLGMYNIRECCFEEIFTKSGENQSYFLVYFDIPKNKSNTPTWFEIKIPFDYECTDDVVEPTYEERLTSYKLYRYGVETVCELTEDEKMILVNVCIKTLLESDGIDMDNKEEEIS